MTPLTWLAVASFTGALLFFAAGLLVARSRADAIRAALGRAQTELAATRADLAVHGDDRRRLADEVMRLTAALGVATRPPPPPSPAPPAAGHPTAAAAELDVLRRRLADLDEVRQENARLRTAVSRARDLEIRLSAADRELAELRHQARSAQAAPRRPTGSGLLRVAATSGVSYDALVAQLARDPRVSAAVVSDDLGLLVAGTGEDAEALAAVGGYLSGVGERAQSLVALGMPTRVVVEDDRGASISATRLVGGPLVAVTLTRDRPAAAR